MGYHRVKVGYVLGRCVFAAAGLDLLWNFANTSDDESDDAFTGGNFGTQARARSPNGGSLEILSASDRLFFNVDQEYPPIIQFIAEFTLDPADIEDSDTTSVEVPRSDLAQRASMVYGPAAGAGDAAMGPAIHATCEYNMGTRFGVEISDDDTAGYALLLEKAAGVYRLRLVSWGDVDGEGGPTPPTFTALGAAHALAGALTVGDRLTIESEVLDADTLAISGKLNGVEVLTAEVPRVAGRCGIGYEAGSPGEEAVRALGWSEWTAHYDQ